MTSSIKDTTVTDAKREALEKQAAEATERKFALRLSSEDQRNGYEVGYFDALVAMEAKPDPEGLREDLLHRVIEAARAYEASCRLGGRHHQFASLKLDEAKSAALTAKPSLEPTRTELVEGLRPFAAIGDNFTIPGGWSDTDRVELSRGFRVLDKVPVSAFRKASALLSRKQSGGGSR